MKRLIKTSIILSIFLSGMFAGCSEDFLNISNENQLDAEIYFTKIENLDLALNSVYASLKSNELYGGQIQPTVLEPLCHTYDQDWLGTLAWNQMCTNEVTSDNDWNMQTWRALYRTVGRANDFIDNANIYKETDMLESEAVTIDKMLGQAHFIRGFAYFTIVRLYGEGRATDKSALAAPLILKVASSRKEMEVGRATVGELYAQVISDFKQAEQLLPDSWDTANAARVDKYAAKGYLGKVYLYQEDWQNAKTYFSQIVNGPFQLVPFSKYEGLFHGETEFSSESIWEINFGDDATDKPHVGGIASRLALRISPKGTGWSNVWPHDVNIRRFGNDPRLRICALEPGVDKVTYANGKTVVLEKFSTEEGGLGWSNKKYVPLNYSVNTTNTGYHANYNMMRLADVYLMYAEVLNALKDDNNALEYVNKVRRRAYGKVYSTPDPIVDYKGLAGTQLRDSIREERFRELFNEGQRWFDIVRWGIAKQECDKYPRVRSGVIKFDDPIDNYLPVPRAELEQNPAMTPSTGYNN